MAFKNSARGWLNGVTADTADIDADAVTNVKIADGTITDAKLNTTPGKIIVQQGVAAAAADSMIVGYAPQAGTIETVGVQLQTPPTSGNLTVGFYSAHNASQVWTSGLLTSATYTITSGPTEYAAQTSATYAYSTVAAGDMIIADIADNGSGFGGYMNVFAVIAPI